MKFVSPLFFPVVAVVLSGCLSKPPPRAENWLIEPDDHELAAVRRKMKWESVRIAQVAVSPPYDGRKLAVLREDGSIAFDPFNEFAAQPSSLLVMLARTAAERSGLFGRVVGGSSHASAEYSLEVSVSRLALDCRSRGVRMATCEIVLTLLHGRQTVGVASAVGKTSAVTGNFTEAFSSACSVALAKAMEKL